MIATTTIDRDRFLESLKQASAQADRTGEEIALHDLRVTRRDGRGPLLFPLPRLTSKLRAVVRRSDTLAEIGTSAFLVVQRAVQNLDGVTTLGRKLLRAATSALESSPLAIEAGPNVGIALYRRQAGVEDLLSRASQAWRCAEASGSCAFHYDSWSAGAGRHSRLVLQHELQHAVRRSELFLEFQPQLDPSGGRIRCIEALIRWRHPVKGVVGPSEFIGVAERTRLISDIGAWIMSEACARCRDWNQSSLPGVPVAINVSAAELEDPGLHGRLVRACRNARLPHHLVELELTERALISSASASNEVLKSIVSSGFAISIDDFGTGYSSLQYLKALPARKLKIPIEFVANVVTDQADRAIVAATVGLAHAFEMDVVAEGVETQEQATLLGNLGCDALQGFLFGRPMQDISDAAARLNQAPAGQASLHLGVGFGDTGRMDNHKEARSLPRKPRGLGEGLAVPGPRLDPESTLAPPPTPYT
ncbi:MAG: putative bifunctional diguanylate cyclase/phosphodiesterase [Thermoanaerobaculia bacterium]